MGGRGRWSRGRGLASLRRVDPTRLWVLGVITRAVMSLATNQKLKRASRGPRGAAALYLHVNRTGRMQLTLSGAELSMGWTRRSGYNGPSPLDGIPLHPLIRGQTTLSLYFSFLLWADDQKCHSNFLKASDNENKHCPQWENRVLRVARGDLTNSNPRRTDVAEVPALGPT